MQKSIEETARAEDVIDAKDLFGKFALDAIATSGFGIESNSFKNPDSIFRTNARIFTRWSNKLRKSNTWQAYNI